MFCKKASYIFLLSPILFHWPQACNLTNKTPGFKKKHFAWPHMKKKVHVKSICTLITSKHSISVWSLKPVSSSQLAFTCSKPTLQTLENGVKYVQS